MTVAMDKAMMAMSIAAEEEDVPFDLPDLPAFSSCESNEFSTPMVRRCQISYLISLENGKNQVAFEV